MKWIYYNDIEKSVHIQNHSLIRLFRAHFSLNRGNFERTFVWSEVISTALWSETKFWAHFSLDNGLELVWTMVWNLSDQRRLRAHFEGTMIFERILVWSEVTSVWDDLIRGPTCLGRSDQRRYRVRPQPG